jgi:hypothetical protein
LPTTFRDVVVSPTVVDNIIAGGDQVQQKLPTTTQIGTEFNFSIGGLNSLFPQFLANQQVGQDITPNPHFGMNLSANVEFVGDPWRAVTDCNFTSLESDSL